MYDATNDRYGVEERIRAVFVLFAEKVQTIIFISIPSNNNAGSRREPTSSRSTFLHTPPLQAQEQADFLPHARLYLHQQQTKNKQGSLGQA
jgi:hypothetical protein